MPGGHGTDLGGRFLAIAEQVVHAMAAVAVPDAGVAVSAKGKLAATGAYVKSGM